MHIFIVGVTAQCNQFSRVQQYNTPALIDDIYTQCPEKDSTVATATNFDTVS